EQVNDRKVRCGLAIGHRSALQHQPSLSTVRVDTLVDQARLAHPRFPNECDDLAVSGSSLYQDLREGNELCLPSDKLREPARCCSLHATTGATRPNELEDFYRLDESLHGHRS